MIAFGHLMLMIWPLLSIIFFVTMHPRTALVATLLGGYLILPTQLGWDVRILPPLDKSSIPAVTALVIAAVYASRRVANLPGWVPRNGWALVFIGFLVLGAFGTALTNKDVLFFGPIWLPGLKPYDGFSIALNFLISLIPFVLGRKFFASIEGQRILLVCIVVAGVIYTLPSLYEIRMSPQLNRMFYGFFPHQFGQHIRNGGFRPVVFLEHGLWLGIFLTATALAAFGLARATPISRWRLYFALAGVWIMGTVFLAKVFGALMILLTLLPVCLFLPRRLYALVLAAITSVMLIYPTMRAADLIPGHYVVSFAGQFSEQRAGSLQFRLDNEDWLLARARQRPLFGWGGYKRNRVYDDKGWDYSTTDGYWIIVFGQFGWVGYFGVFGLLGGGIIALAFQAGRKVHLYSLVLATVLLANIIDLIPNGSISPFAWLIAGAMFGRLENFAEDSEEASASVAERPKTRLQRPGLEHAPKRSSGPVYRRDFSNSRQGKR